MKTNKPDSDFGRHWDQELSDSIPSISELAHLAALLVRGRAKRSPDLGIAARQAIDLWFACDEARKHKITELGLLELAKAQQSYASDEMPRPESFPVSFDDFLRFALPNKKPEDRMKIYREETRAKLLDSGRRHRNGAPKLISEIHIPTDEDCAKVIAENRKNGFGQLDFYDCLVSLRGFATRYKKENLKKRGQNAGLKSAAEKKAKKLV